MPVAMEADIYLKNLPHLDSHEAFSRLSVIGSAVSGRGAATLAARLGAKVTLLERDLNRISPELKDFLDERSIELVVGDHKPGDLADADLIVLSPGVQAEKIRALLPEKKRLQPGLIISELELAWRYSDAPVLAVTGTNGKTTTATLAARMLEVSGHRVFLGGNIGTPLSEYVLGRMDGEEKADVLVLEVSSFQLQSCYSFKPKAAVFLNFSPNHLDWHQDMQEYLSAKLNIFEGQSKDDLAVLSEDLWRDIEASMPGKGQVVFFNPSHACRFAAPFMLGRHNHGNIEAAFLAAGRFGLDEEKVRAMMKDFHGLPHRLEYMGETSGVHFINDSKSTSVESLRAALEAMEWPVHLLAGGVFKGGNLRSLLPLMSDKVSSVGLFGGSREIFEEAWAEAGTLLWAETLEEACQAAFERARPGEVILLSPATASFDLYSDYKARGNDFKRIFEILSR